MATLQSTMQLAYEQTPRYENAPVVSPYVVSTAVRYMPITNFRITPTPGLTDRADELRGVEGAIPSIIDSFAPAGEIAVRAYANDLIFLLGLAGYQATVTAGAATPDLWTLSQGGTWSGGSFTLTVTPGAGSPVTTGPIQWNATAKDVASAIQAVVPNSVIVLAAGGPLPGTPVTITLSGSVSGRSSTVALGVSSLTGTAPVVTLVHTTTGANGGSAVLADGGYPTTGTNVWQFVKRTGLQAKSAQLLACYVNEGVFLQGQGYALSQIGGNSDGAITATLLGLVLKRLASDPNLTPAYDTQAIPHLREGDMFLTWLTGSAISTDFTWQIANPLEAIRTFGLQSFFPDTLYQGPGRAAVTGTMPKRALGAADFDALVQAATFSAVAQWHSAKQIAATGQVYSMFLSMPSCQYVGGDPDPLTNARRFGASFNWFAAYDEASGYDAQFTILSSLAATSVASAGVGL